MADSIHPVPVTVLTGFLGAGKTTLLNRILRDSAFAGTAVLINEFGEIGIDHLLVETPDEMGDDDTVLLASGCLCCTIRGDLTRALQRLIPRVSTGQVRRVVIETTGLARPAPILHTFASDPATTLHFRLDGVVTVVDAINVQTQLDQQPECVEQITVSDLIVMSKTDLAGASVTIDATACVQRLNPGARIVTASNGEIDARILIDLDHAGSGPTVASWLAAEAVTAAEHHEHHHHDRNRHDARISAFCVTFDEPLHWQGIGTCLEMLVATRGENLLRVKGILNLVGQDRPVVIHGVQHMFYPPALLPAWSECDSRSSRIVFITRDLPRAIIEDGMRAFASAAMVSQP